MCRCEPSGASDVGAAHPAAPRRLNFRVIAGLTLCNAAHFYSICSIFSYAAFLCVDMGWVEEIDEAGFIAGLLPTLLMLGRILTSWPWGVLSDRIGVVACLRLSMISVALGNILFGFATQKWAALAVRFFLLGAGNGWVSLIGPISNDVGGAERQSEVLSLVFASGPVVQMIGPAIGGWLYGTILPDFPAIAPSLVGAFVAILGAVFGAGALENAILPKRSSEAALEPAALPKGAADGAAPGGVDPLDASIELADAAPVASVEGSNLARPATIDGPPPRRPSLCSVMLSHPFPLVMLVRSGGGALMFGMFDVLPLWLAASRPVGGLALGKQHLGLVLAAASFAMMPWVTYPNGVCIRRQGVRTALLVSLLVTAVVYASIVPLTLAAFPLSPVGGAAICVVFAAIGGSAVTTTATAAFAATNNACERHRDRLGSISGVAVTVEAIGKMAGPGLGAPMLSALLAALKPSAAPPDGASIEPSPTLAMANGAFATFGVFAAFSLLLALASLALPRSVEAPRRSALLSGSSSTRSDHPSHGGANEGGGKEGAPAE